MKKRSDKTEWDAERKKIIGLGESSIRKTYFPQLQQKLDELERFRALLDQTRDAIFLIRASSLAIIDINSSACHDVRCSRDRLMSARLHDFLSDDAIRSIEETVSSGSTGGERVILATFRTCSGHEFPAEITFRLVTFNEVVYGVVVARDISERKRAEEELRQSEERLRFASSAAAVGTWNWDLKKDTLVWSARCKELFGFPPDFTVTYEAFLGALFEEDRAAVDRAVWKALHEHSEYLVEIRVKLPDGGSRWVLSKGRGFYDEKGKPLGMHGIAMDITDRKNYEEELVEARAAAEGANRAKSQFLANISHELRTPINGILGVLQMILGGYAGSIDGYQKDLLRKSDRSARALLRIIDDILDLSRIEAGKLSLKEEDFSLREAVSDAVELFAMEAPKKGLYLRFSIHENVPEHLTGDAVRLRQVLVNLVGNALKFTSEGGVEVVVSLSSRAADGTTHVKFSVTDTGIGIPADKREILFHPFTQLDPSDTRQFGGTGLGLAISSRLVEMMGGTISFESTEGAGSSFFFTIPLRVTTQPAIPPPAPSATPSPERGRRLRILVAEDDPLASDLLIDILEYHGLEANLAQTGRQAVEMWEKGKYDLIIMDVQMPQMDGITATHLIREKEKSRGSHVPIMAMTAHAFPEDEKRCRAAGMDSYQTKPLDMEKGLHMIHSLLRGEKPEQRA